MKILFAIARYLLAAFLALCVWEGFISPDTPGIKISLILFFLALVFIVCPGWYGPLTPLVHLFRKKAPSVKLDGF